MQVEEKIIKNYEDKNTINVDNFPPKLDNLINNIIIKEGYKTYDVERKVISTNGGNYLGILYEIDVKGETADGPKETNIFVKNIVSNGENLKTLSLLKAYRLETFAYKELCNIFNELQDEAGIPAPERFKMVKCFDECNPEAIILDNVARKGYKTAYRMDVVSLKYAEIAIQLLAKFHALSFVIKEKRPNYFNEKIKAIETPMIFSEDWDGFIKSICTLTLNCLDDEMRQKMEKIFPNLLDKIPRYMQEASKLRCLCHGDYKANNIMMKEANGEVVDLIPIDYQLMYFGCPILDFLYFIYTATDRAFRKDNLTYLKNSYYDVLKKFLAFFDINAETVYAKAEFENDFKERLDYGLMMTIVSRPFIFVDKDDVPDVTKDSMKSLSFKVHDKYKDVLRETLEEFIDWGYLDTY